MAVVTVLEVMQKVEKTTPFYGDVRPHMCSSTYAENGNVWQKMKTCHSSQH